MNQNLYVGRCLYEPQPFTRFQLLAEVSERRWRARNDWADQLPPEGMAFSPRNPGVEMGDLLVFRVTETERPDGRDSYIVQPVTAPAIVLDYRQMATEKVRDLLVEQGLSPEAIRGGRYIVALAGETCVELEMLRDPSTGRWIADRRDLARQPLYHLDPHLFDGEQIDGHWLAIPGVTVAEQVGQVDWTPDGEFLETVLKRLRRSSQFALPGGPLTKPQIAALVSDATKAGVLPGGSEDLKPMLTRLADFAPRFAASYEMVGQLVDAVASFKQVDTRLGEEVEKRRSFLEESVRDSIEAEVRNHLGPKFEQFQRETAKLESQIADRRADLSAVQSDLLRALDLLGAEVADPSGGASALAEQILDNLATNSTLGGRLGTQSPVVAPWQTAQAMSPAYAAWSEFKRTLDTAANDAGFDPVDLAAADIAVRSRELVVLPQRIARAFVGAYADAIAGGRLIIQPMDPAVLSVDDIWRKPPTQDLTGFARAMAAARSKREAYVVVLIDGMNRSESRLWLPTLAAEAEASRWPQNFLMFASLDDDDLQHQPTWASIGDFTTPLQPVRSVVVTPNELRLANGEEPPSFQFDAKSVPIADRAVALSAAYQADSNTRGAARRVRRANALQAHVFGDDSTGDRIAQLIEARLSHGAVWLRKRLGIDKAGGTG